MRRSLGFQQQCYADDGMWMGTQAQQQSYAVHEESWSSDNHYHKQFPGTHLKLGAFAVDSELLNSKQHGKLLGGSHGMFQEVRLGGRSHDIFEEGSLFHRNGYVAGGAKKFPFGATNVSQFSNGRHHGYFSEKTEYEAYSEVHRGRATMKVDEMRYKRHQWGGDGFCTNPYDRNKHKNMTLKPHGKSSSGQ